MTRRLLSGGLLVLVVAGSSIGLVQRDRIGDWLVLQSYDRPAAITQLATATTMNDTGKRLFYVNRPAIEDRTTFNENCRNISEKTVVLGCYHGNRQGIHIFGVDSAELQGVQEVTAAHEMLHQAYDRLSGSERNHINGLLNDFYKNHLQDETVKDQIVAYQKSEPDAVINEMHSLFGTEVSNLTPELQQYYGRYFTNRSKVTDFYAHYQGAFTQRKQQIDQYDSQLSTQKKDITTLQAALDDQLSKLNSQKGQMDDYRQNGNTTAYNQLVGSYNAVVDAYNNDLQLLKQKIAAYNAVVVQRNAIAAQEDQLQQELSSKQLQSASSE